MRLAAGLVCFFWITVAQPASADVAWVDGDWMVQCSLDRMTDKSKCLLNDKTPHLYDNGIYVSARLVGSTLRVGAYNYPGSEMVVRIDSNPARRVTESSAFAVGANSTLWREIKNGTTLRYRWHSWNTDTVYEGEVNLPGLVEAFEKAQKYLVECPNASCAKPDGTAPPY